MEHDAEVIGFGALNCDRIYKVDDLALPGREVGVVSAIGQPGGSAANTIVGLARLGVRTGFLGTVGDDREGTQLLDDLRREGVDVHGITISKGNTGSALIFVDSRGERAIYILPSVNDTYYTADHDYAAKAKVLHISSFMGIDQFRMQISYVRNLHRARTKISFSPGDIYTQLGIDQLKPLMRRAFTLFLNQEEAERLTGSARVEDTSTLLDFGADIVAVTLGEAGAYVATRSESLYVSPYESRITDTVGAGDAFAAGFLYGQLNSKDLHTSALYGNFMASRSVAQLGGRKGLLRDLRQIHG